MPSLGGGSESGCLRWTGVKEVNEEVEDLNAGVCHRCRFRGYPRRGRKEDGEPAAMTIIPDWKVDL